MRVAWSTRRTGVLAVASFTAPANSHTVTAVYGEDPDNAPDGFTAGRHDISAIGGGTRDVPARPARWH
ncbi:hypothetical protein [Amycolatopsis taiwanensis]|uniref:Uncharacterized protein n=1 Tax=Amycolatopsis taiwanensis TaxID=342230 RepID=A0A9W6VD20_9PSEU|nr:hypothetical protein [Amycolatopsis taiwanensis]GLY64340.1 hypothetical protein Atai01_09590 [Amycolatopsis taiwanensis]